MPSKKEPETPGSDHALTDRQLFLAQLEERIAAIEENWSEYSRGGWAAERLEALYSRISETSEASSKLELMQLHEAVFSIEVYLSSFVDAGKKPSGHQVQEIDGLVRTLKATAEYLVEGNEETGHQTGGGLIFIYAGPNSPAMDVRPALQAMNFRVEAFDDSQLLVSAMGKSLPKAILTDVALLSHLDPITSELVRLESQQQIKIPMAFVAKSSALQPRVDAMRAGADAFFVAPFEAEAVAEQVARLSQPRSDERIRVMIVEDDPTQADFASGILRKAGMDTCKVMEPLKVIDELAEFHPDLILMDIYMPDVNGMELTTIIRDYKEFAPIPIVFLSGEHSTEKQMDALSVGGDDFITKPVSPKQLITVVKHRVHRSRSLIRAYGGKRQQDRVTGLFSRQHFLDRIAHHLQQDDNPCAVLHLTPDDLETHRKVLGIGSLDALLKSWAKQVTQEIDPQDMACRVDDHSLAICIRGKTENQVHEIANRLLAVLKDLPVPGTDAGRQITASVGIVFAESGDDESGILARAERACRRAAETGGNQLADYADAEPETVIAAPVEDNIADALQRCFDEDRLVILYQPILDLRSRGSESYEIMLRVPLANGDLVDEHGYREAAEQIGLSIEIDRLLLSRAIDILKERRDSGRKTQIFVRQSKTSAADEQYPSIVKAELEAHDTPGTGLVLDYRLTDVSPNLKLAQANIAALHALEVETCISRFPEKPAAFKVLKFLGADYLSVAPRLLKADRAVISSVTRMAHEAEVKVIVPNVDDARSIDLHWSAGADFLQGNFIQRPLENLDYDFSQVVI